MQAMDDARWRPLACRPPAGAASAAAAHIPPPSIAGHVCFDLLAFAPSPRRAAAMSSLCCSVQRPVPCSVQPARQLRSAAHVSNPAPLHNALARRAGGAARRWVETASGGVAAVQGCSSSRPAGGACGPGRSLRITRRRRRAGRSPRLPLDRQPPSTPGSALARRCCPSPASHLPAGCWCCRERGAAVRVSAFQLPTSKWWQKEAPPNVIHISSVQQLVDAMVGAGG